MSNPTIYRGSRSSFASSDPEFESVLGRLDPETGPAPTAGINRGSREFFIWVQRTLNSVMGLRLAVDGILGPETRRAIRSFQQRHGLAVDGNVGPATEQRLRQVSGTSSQATAAATCPPKPVFVDCPSSGQPFEVLDEFAFNRSELNRPRHEPLLENIVEEVVASMGTSQPIRIILIAGHTDPVGGVDFNFDLGRRRAETVLLELCKLLNSRRPGCTAGLTFQMTTCGERQPKATDAASRRVEVFFPGRSSFPLDPGLQTCLDQCERAFQRCLGTGSFNDCARQRGRCKRDCRGRPA
jgi:outer membrane protein OmpA-like peptidoglycan-associated protein